MRDCEELIWPALESALRDSISITSDNGQCVVTVPFERFDGDAITLRIIPEGDQYVITDESETYGMLYLSNVDLDQGRRERRLNSIAERFDLEQAQYEIRLRTPENELGDRLLDAVQAVQSISYLAYTRRRYTTSDFHDEVEQFLSDHEFRFDRNAKVKGDLDDHRVDFSIHNEKPIYLQALHAENPSSAKDMAIRTEWKWTDIKEKYPDVFRVSIFDDESGETDEQAIRILQKYSDSYVPWSQKQQLPHTLAQA